MQVPPAPRLQAACGRQMPQLALLSRGPCENGPDEVPGPHWTLGLVVPPPPGTDKDAGTEFSNSAQGQYWPSQEWSQF